ncbi:MAG: VWA domain-containing protein [bacterium]|nr:VWA domain-containing protein [bacterium]
MGIANLFGLLSLLSIPALVLIYSFSRRRRRVEISSIIPWRLLRESVVRSSLFRADLLFILQLAALLALAAAACRPYWRSAAAAARGRHLVLVLDRSASMQAVEGGATRWELARQRALRIVRGLGPADRATVIVSGAAPRVVAAGEADASALARLIGGLEAADTPDRMAPAVETAFALLREGEDEAGEVHILTDRSAASLGLPAGGGPARLWRVGSPKANAAITGVAVYGDPFAAGEGVSAYVTVENFSDAPFSGTLRADAGGREVGSRPVRLAPGGSLTTRAGERFPEGLLRISLEPTDALPVDNTAWAILAGGRISRIALVTRDDACAARMRALAAAIPRLALDVHSPASYASADLERAQVAIFHRCEPERHPPTNVLVICPPVRSRMLRVTGEWVTGLSFLDWDESHPVGRNLRGLHAVPLGGSRIIETPAWARPVVISATTRGDVPLVVCGETEGRRAAVMSFDLCDARLGEGESLPLLILFLNVLRWLGAGDADGVRTGEAYRTLAPPGGPGRYTVVTPGGRREIVPAEPGGPIVFGATEEAGRYVLSGGAVSREFVANLCDRTESDLRADPEGEDRAALAAVLAAGPPPDAAPPDRSALFLLLAGAVLGIEWILWAARAARAGRPGEDETAAAGSAAGDE